MASLISRDRYGFLQGIHICSTWEAVANWITRLRKTGVNYFVPFLESHGPALQFCHSDMSGEGVRYYVGATDTPLAYEKDYDPYGWKAERRLAACIRRHHKNEVRKLGKKALQFDLGGEG